MDQLIMHAAGIRKGVIETVYQQKQGHVGGPLSAADILSVLYFDIMTIKPEDPDWPERDRFVLSKGHSAIGLYVTLALRGYFPYAELATFDALHSRLQAHPDMTKLPGLDMSTGSLGQGISSGVGMALAAKRQNKAYKTYVLLGDGESQEGQVWEAARVAERYQLGNLVVIVDANNLQQYGWQSDDKNGRDTPDSNHGAKWKAFGWNVSEVDGHDISALKETLQHITSAPDGKPKAVIAHTVKGKGVSFMEGNFKWHSNVPTDEEFEHAMSELEEV
ncbi:transketolase [Thalassobacillus sp. CUG 92003]|uniref:transketolase n=1 Tax=Thalassobacillus sp. CUG 92003 TaxID=2736641 RepID=UPI0015E65A6B|nr:transketolase [Thalassobacillus sp. CUG 92003]